MNITKNPLPLAANGTAAIRTLSETSAGVKLRLQHFDIAADGGVERAQTQKSPAAMYWNEMTNDERVAKLPELVTILDDGRSCAFREVLTEMLADIAGRPADLLLLMKPIRQRKRALPPQLSKLLEQVEDELQARGSKMSGGLSALAVESGITADRIISLLTDAPGIAVQVGNDESNLALIECEGGQ